MKNALYLALLLLQAAPAFGAEALLRVCSLSLPPQTMQGADGAPTGYAVEILQHVARELRWSIRIDYLPWARVVSETRARRCDMAMTQFQEDRRIQDADQPLPAGSQRRRLDRRQWLSQFSLHGGVQLDLLM